MPFTLSEWKTLAQNFRNNSENYTSSVPCVLFPQASVLSVSASTPIMASSLSFITLVYVHCCPWVVSNCRAKTVPYSSLCPQLFTWWCANTRSFKNAPWSNKRFTSEAFSSAGAMISGQGENHTLDTPRPSKRSLPLLPLGCGQLGGDVTAPSPAPSGILQQWEKAS